MMKKKVLLTLLFIITSAALWAQSDATQQLVVWLKTGQPVRYDLAKEPVTTFEDGKLVIKCSNEAAAYYQLENVLRYTYEGAMTAIGAQKLRPGEIIFRQGEGQMSFDGLPEGTLLDVYALDGKKLFTETARNGQSAVISLASYPAGTYIVKVGDATYKLMKK